MLTIKVKISESLNEADMTFDYTYFTLELEHSLLSLSIWESEFEKPFLDNVERTDEEAIGYIRAMILTPDYPADLLDKMSTKNVSQINNYIDKKMTGTWFNEPPSNQPGRPRSSQKITNELIYYWMTSYQIPWEAERWHLNRLFTLIKVFNAQNEKKKPVDAKTAAEQRRALNAKRKAAANTRG